MESAVAIQLISALDSPGGGGGGELRYILGGYVLPETENFRPRF